MTRTEISQPVVLSRNASDPSIRVPLETGRGSVVAQLEGVVDPDVSIQWFRNNELIPGETSATIHFAELDFDDSDLYFATISTSQSVERSQSLILAVVPGQPLLNFSARSFVSPQTPMVAGFVIGGGSRAMQPKSRGAEAAEPNPWFYRPPRMIPGFESSRKKREPSRWKKMLRILSPPRRSGRASIP